MRILVTGGAGYIGSHATRLFLREGHDVQVFDNLVYGHAQAVPADRLIVGDLGEAARLDHALLTHRIEAVVHFAAFAYVGESVRDPAKYYRNNLVNTLTLMECMRRNGVREAAREVVVRHRRVAGARQRLAGVRADVARAAGDQDRRHAP